MARRIIAALVFIAAFGSAGTRLGHAGAVVEIRPAGHYYIEPANVRVTVAVEPNDDNRILRIEADGDLLFRSSDITLSGANAARLYSIYFNNLPAGTYTLRARVLGPSDVIRGIAWREVKVSGAGQR